MQSGSRPNPDDEALSAPASGCDDDWTPDRAPLIGGVVFWTWRVREGLWRLSSEFDRLLQAGAAESLRSATDKWWSGRVHEEDLPDLVQIKRDLLENRITSFDAIFRLYRFDDCWVWCSSKGQVSERDEKGPLVVSGITTNISRLRSDRKFQQDGAGVGDPNYHAMLENSPDLYVRMDSELFPLYMNPIVVRYMGREREQFFYDDSLEELKMEPEHLAFLQRNVRRVFDEGVTVRELTTFKSFDGQEVTGEYSFWPEYDADGRVTTAMTHFRDLTEQARAEKNARLNERRLSALHELTQLEDEPDDEVLKFVLESLLSLTSSGSGFIFLPDGDLRGAGRTLWSRDHYGKIDAAYLTEDRFPPDLAALVADADGELSFPSIRNGDGVGPVHVSFNGAMPIIRSMIAAEQERGRPVLVAGVCNKDSAYVEADLKQLQMFINGAWLRLRRRRLVNELRRAKEAAEEANKAKSSFLANISHELRTPLNGMLSMLQLLDIEGLNDEQGEYVKAALFSGNTLVRIISDILDLSRMETGQMELTPGVFDPKRSLAATLRIFQDEAVQKGLAFTVAIDPAIPGSLYGDDARMRQIVFNLVGNALKFTDDGSIAVECSLLRTAEDGSVTLYIGVSDTGIGIPPEQQGRIFDPFTQVDNSSTRRYPGTGLGLSIVRRLVSLMHGSVTVESEPGRGTTIHCTLAFAATREEAALAPGDAVPHCGEQAAMDILVAEDDDVSAFAIRTFLKRCGHRVACVPNGRKALEALQLHRFDCVFTDIQMPDMDGLELAKRIRSGRAAETPPARHVRELLLAVFSAEEVGAVEPDPEIPIVAVTAHAMAGDRERFLRSGITDYISKPIVVEQLTRVLGRLRR